MAVPDEKKLVREIADDLADKIIHLKLWPGERLSAAGLKKKYRAGEGPVREAFRILENYQFVEPVPNKGYQVTNLSPEFFQSLFDIMTDMLGLILRRLAQKHTAEELGWLLKLEKFALEAAGKNDPTAFSMLIVQMTMIALEAARNPILADMVGDWVPSLRRAYFLTLSYSEFNIKDAVQTLQALKTHVMEQDPDQAEKTVRAYVGRERKRVLKIIENHWKES